MKLTAEQRSELLALKKFFNRHPRLKPLSSLAFRCLSLTYFQATIIALIIITAMAVIKLSGAEAIEPRPSFEESAFLEVINTLENLNLPTLDIDRPKIIHWQSALEARGVEAAYLRGSNQVVMPSPYNNTYPPHQIILKHEYCHALFAYFDGEEQERVCHRLYHTGDREYVLFF